MGSATSGARLVATIAPLSRAPLTRRCRELVWNAACTSDFHCWVIIKSPSVGDARVIVIVGISPKFGADARGGGAEAMKSWVSASVTHRNFA
jgi:hypothetical protein